jgi:hypothetical protein
MKFDDIKFRYENDGRDNIRVTGSIVLDHFLTIDRHFDSPEIRDQAKEELRRSIVEKIYGSIRQEARELCHESISGLQKCPEMGYRTFEQIHKMFEPFTHAGDGLLVNDKKP